MDLLLTGVFGAIGAIAFLCCVSPAVRKDVFHYFDLFSEIREEQKPKE